MGDTKDMRTIRRKRRKPASGVLPDTLRSGTNPDHVLFIDKQCIDPGQAFRQSNRFNTATGTHAKKPPVTSRKIKRSVFLLRYCHDIGGSKISGALIEGENIS